MKTITWTVRIKNAPAAVRYCKRCGVKTSFVSSGLFRINAQQKNLDVWLIYKCSACGATWNTTVLSRVNPRSIPQKTLEGFHSNDAGLAMRYASDVALIKKNGGEPGLPSIETEGAAADFAKPARIHLIAEHPAEIRALTVLRDKLGLSRSEIARMCDSGQLRCVSGQDIKKCRLTAGEIILETGLQKARDV